MGRSFLHINLDTSSQFEYVTSILMSSGDNKIEAIVGVGQKDPKNIKCSQCKCSKCNSRVSGIVFSFTF